MRPIDADVVDAQIYNEIPIKVFGNVKRMAAMREIIANAPTLDAVEVVRCKDCRYWMQEVDYQTHWVCKQHSFDGRLMHTTPDFYCADGERK